MQFLFHYISIEQIKNSYLEDAYEAMKKILGKQCTGFIPNELKLFHGTKDATIGGITEDGFVDRYFNQDGSWGRFYFTLNLHFFLKNSFDYGYTAFDNPDHTHVMFYNKMLLGNQLLLQNSDHTLVSVPIGYHSAKGTTFTYPDYIIYRYSQAKSSFEN